MYNSIIGFADDKKNAKSSKAKIDEYYIQDGKYYRKRDNKMWGFTAKELESHITKDIDNVKMVVQEDKCHEIGGEYYFKWHCCYLLGALYLEFVKTKCLKEDRVSVDSFTLGNFGYYLGLCNGYCHHDNAMEVAYWMQEFDPKKTVQTWPFDVIYGPISSSPTTFFMMGSDPIIFEAKLASTLTALMSSMWAMFPRRTGLIR